MGWQPMVMPSMVKLRSPERCSAAMITGRLWARKAVGGMIDSRRFRCRRVRSRPRGSIDIRFRTGGPNEGNSSGMVIHMTRRGGISGFDESAQKRRLHGPPQADLPSVPGREAAGSAPQGKRAARWRGELLEAPEGRNEIWAMDFMSSAGGRKTAQGFADY